MTDRRGVSTTLNYVLGLGIAFLLVVGLLVAGGNFVQDQREQAIENELRVIGQQVAADAAIADRLASTTTTDGTVVVERNLPEEVSGSSYSIAVAVGSDPTDPHLELESTNPEVSVEVELTNETNMALREVNGGDVEFTFETGGEIRLEAG